MEELINHSPLFLVILLLIVGFVLLIKGADYFVEGSSSIAKRFQVPSLIIGLTIVAMGTSLPETAVSVTASLVGNNELAIGNAIGSNIFNLMIVIGICACLNVIPVSQDTIRSDIPFSAICAILLLALGYLGIGDRDKMILGHLDGILFLLIFILFIISLIRRALKARQAGQAVEEEEIVEISMIKSILFILLGAAAIAIGGDLTVDSASRIAIDLGMSQTLVGLTIVSVGTSLPELVTSFVAARKNEIGMALGNAIGSNIFNILMVLGVASAISPIPLIMENIIDITVLLVFTLIVWLFAYTKNRISRREGIVMIALYLAYLAYIIIR